MSVAVMILAAGQSSRLGSPKQLVPFNGKTLLRHTIDEAKAIEPVETVVILGAHDAAIMDALGEDPDILLVHNNLWEEGMASSIRCGIRHMMTRSYDGVIIMVCDQPHVNRALLAALREAFRKADAPIVAAEYDGIPGTPALFHRSMYEELLQLKGDKGAKQLIVHHKDSAVFVGFPDGITDIDTPGDVEALARLNSKS